MRARARPRVFRHCATLALLLVAAAPGGTGSSADETVPREFRGACYCRAGDELICAGDLTARQRDVRSRPALRLVPGLIISQHQGGGKAEQYLIRGFDADHGTDLAIFVDGLPVNLRSHGHGQGYADLHFVIPETIKLVDVLKGPYFPEYGDFDTAGAVVFLTRDYVEENTLEVAGGSFNTQDRKSVV